MRDLLVRVRDTSRWNCAVAYAADLAARLGATLTGAHPIDPARDAAASEDAAAERFESWATSMGAASASWQRLGGDVAAALGHLSLWHDLVIVDRDPHEPTTSVSELGAIAVASEAPVLLVPQRRREAHLNCIALAWNHSRESLKAIHAARPLIERASRVVVLEGAPDARTGSSGSVFDLGRLLARWGVNPDREPIGGESSLAGEMLVTAARRSRADLLVMGAYGRSRLSEWALGGATRSVLFDASMPVFLRH